MQTIQDIKNMREAFAGQSGHAQHEWQRRVEKGERAAAPAWFVGDPAALAEVAAARKQFETAATNVKSSVATLESPARVFGWVAGAVGTFTLGAGVVAYFAGSTEASTAGMPLLAGAIGCLSAAITTHIFAATARSSQRKQEAEAIARALKAFGDGLPNLDLTPVTEPKTGVMKQAVTSEDAFEAHLASAITQSPGIYQKLIDRQNEKYRLAREAEANRPVLSDEQLAAQAKARGEAVFGSLREKMKERTAREKAEALKAMTAPNPSVSMRRKVAM